MGSQPQTSHAPATYVNFSTLLSGYNGYYVFQPGIGYTVNGSGNSTYPHPDSNYAYGWIQESGGVAYRLPAGPWNFSTELAVYNSASLPSGKEGFGVALFLYNTTNSSFVNAFVINRSVNFFQYSGNHNFWLNLSAEENGISVASDEKMFAEYFVYMDNVSFTGTLSISFEVGGPEGGSYNVTYPYHGWIAGSVYPHWAKVTIDGKAVSTTAGSFNVSVYPSFYTADINSTYFINRTFDGQVLPGETWQLDVNLTREYVVYFNESGLPTGTSWSVDMNGSGANSTGSSIHFILPNGTYSFSIGGIRGYSVSNASGNITVRGGNETVMELFTAIRYGVTFQAEGLPPGSMWNISLSGTVYVVSGSTFTLQLTAGRYTYRISAPPGYRASNSSGTLYVNYSSVKMNITFAKLYYMVVFHETGLPAGDAWTLDVNGSSYTLNASYFTVYLPYGYSNYSVLAPHGFRPALYDSTVFISGNTTVELSFIEASGIAPSIFGVNAYLFLLLAALIAAETITVYLYFDARRKREGKRTFEDASDGAAVLKIPGGEELVAGCTYAFFEGKAEKAMETFERAVRSGYQGLCFTREHPEKLRQKYRIEGSELVWLTTVSTEGAVRPRDLEKISLLCSEFLKGPGRIVLIDGIEYLIANNNFITVLKLIQSIRDETAVKKSILAISLNPDALKEGEVSLITKEMDGVVR